MSWTFSCQLPRAKQTVVPVLTNSATHYPTKVKISLLFIRLLDIVSVLNGTKQKIHVME